MRSGISRSVIVFAVFCLVVLVLPQYVKAEVQTQVTEIAKFSPAESNNNAVDNIANDTITLNYATWDPLPPGVFVGGVLRESSMQLNEYATGISQTVDAYPGVTSQLMMAQPIQFNASYLSSGASQAVIRLPIVCGPNSTPLAIWFEMFKMDSAADYKIVARDSYMGRVFSSAFGPLDVMASDGSNLHLIATMGVRAPFSSSPSTWFYERSNRIYLSLNTPMHSGQWYLLITKAYYAADKRWQFYLNPADVGSDGNVASSVAYEYYPAPDQNVTHTYAIPADLGYSFVFTYGLGGDAISYNRYFQAGDELGFTYLIPCPAGQPYIIGALNFVTEFRVNASQYLTWGLEISTTINFGGVNITKTVLSHTYWTGKLSQNVIMASNPTLFNYTGSLIAGSYYIQLRGTIYFEAAQRVTFLMYDAGDSAVYGYQSPYQRVWHYDGAGHDVEQIFFDLWQSASIDSLSYNLTGTHSPGKSFEAGISHWWSQHWMDMLGILLIVVGLVAAPFTLGGSLALISIGVGMILYNNFQEVRDFVNGILKGILDGLSWLGNWLWKLGEAIWKALTWFVDQAIYYGSILIGLLIIGVAIALFIGPIYALIKIMGAFLMMAQGDYDKAAAQLSGLAAQGSHVASTLTGGRVG